MTTTEYLYTTKIKVDELEILGSPMDIEDVTDVVLVGLGDEYKELARAIQACESPVSFEELHEKLLTFDVNTTKAEPLHYPSTANIATK